MNKEAAWNECMYPCETLVSASRIRVTCKKSAEFDGPVTGGTYSVWAGKHIIALIHDDDDDVVIVMEKTTGDPIYEHENITRV